MQHTKNERRELITIIRLTQEEKKRITEKPSAGKIMPLHRYAFLNLFPHQYFLLQNAPGNAHPGPDVLTVFFASADAKRRIHPQLLQRPGSDTHRECRQSVP